MSAVETVSEDRVILVCTRERALAEPLDACQIGQTTRVDFVSRAA